MLNLTLDVADSKNYPDIYLIVLDEYASFKTIKEEWCYDNSKFAEFLKNKGFFVADNSNSRYIQTTWCLASLLNLDYITEPVSQNTYLDFLYDKEKVNESEEYKMLNKMDEFKVAQLFNNNIFTSFLKDRGYKTIILEGLSQHYSSFKILNTDISIGYQDVNSKENYDLLTDAFYLELLKKSIISPILQFANVNPINNVNYDGARFIFNYLKTNMEVIEIPKFIFAHILSPHYPYVFDRKGNYLEKSPDPRKERKGVLIKEKNTVNSAYLEQYIYVTNEMKKVITSIQNKSKQKPVIIIQSDHSPRPHELYLKDKTNAFNVLNAVYFPDGDYQNIYDSIAPVNTLRILLNTYFNENYKLVEDN
jgi:Sulfatase